MVSTKAGSPVSHRFIWKGLFTHCIITNRVFSSDNFTTRDRLCHADFVRRKRVADYSLSNPGAPIIQGNEIFKAQLGRFSDRSYVPQTRTPAVILTTTFFHALAFFSGLFFTLRFINDYETYAFTGSYYLPVYFQVLGNSATGAGVR